MNAKQNSILRLAVAAAFVGGASMANAAITLTSNAPTAVKFASELPTTGLDLLSASSDLSLEAAGTAFTPSAGQSLQISVALSNGASFKGTPIALCSTVGNTSANSGILNLGGADTGIAVFTFSSARIDTAVGVSSCVISAASGITVASGAHSDIRASITYQYGTLSSSMHSGGIITFVKGVSAFASAATTLTAMVTAGFTTIGNTSTVTGTLGQVYYRGNGVARLDSTATKISATDVVSSATITLAGNALAAAKASSGVYLVTAQASCITADISGYAGPGVSVTFGSTATFATQLATGYKACITFDGTTAISSGSITASINTTNNTGYSASTTLASGSVADITRNGSSTRAMNIPAANNTDQAFVRVTNTSSLAGKVYGTLYGQDGVVLGTANSVLADSTAFVSNATVVFDAATLKTKLGISSDWTGRAQLIITAETPTMRAQNLVRTANGTLVNVGGDTSTANN